MNEYTEQEQGRSNVFEDSSISRRQFVRLSATTAGAVALPGQAVAELSSSKLTDEYQYVINHTEEREEVPTLITFSEEAGLNELADLRVSTRTTTKPTVAAHTYLTTEQVEQVLKLGSVTKLQFSPGSNPFWLLDYYPQGVFPDPEDSVDFIDYEQLSQGMEYLAEQYPDRLRFQSIGHSPGHYNFFTDEEDPKDVWIAEVTNDINDGERFQEKEKLVFSLSIHADERGGVEAGTRFIEDVLTGDESSVKALLEEFVLIFVYTNPDGWVARYPQYNDRGEGYERYTAGTTRFSNEPIDPNRNYPTIGWIDATHYPAEPAGLNLENNDPEIDQDVAGGYTDNVIDALNIVEYLREYDNLSYGFDLHGMYSSKWMIEGATVNEQYSYTELNDIYEYSNILERRLDENLGPLLDENEKLFEGLQSEEFFGEDATIPESAFTYGTNQDVLDYGTTGYLSSWMAHPEENGGLGMKVMLHELAFNNMPTPTTYAVADDFEVSNLVELWVIGFTTVMRTLVEHAAENVEATLETNDRSTAVVTTESLTRSSDQLEFIGLEELEVSSTENGILTGHVLDTGGDRTVETPDPEEILEYEQRTYEASPFVFFDMLANEIPDDQQGFVELTVDEVSNKGLLTEDSQTDYENLIIIHDEGMSNQAYLNAIDEYVEAGGNLVLTDTGVELLASLENEAAAGITSENIMTGNTAFAVLEEDTYPNNLLADTRPYQDQLWRNAPLGYGVPRRGSDNEVAMPLVDPDAFVDAGGEVAATTNEKVALGSIRPDTDAKTGITILSTLLPPARQVHLHPFGMADYTISFFGLLILTNALGYSHYWYVNDKLVRRIGAPESEDGTEG